MGFYSDMFNAGNRSGICTFDADALTATVVTKSDPDPNGEKVEAVIAGRTITDILVHRNGRRGTRDLTKDTIILSTEKLAAMTDAQQVALYQFERTPGSGRREGVVKPPRERTAVTRG